jgi:hypothetical protein
MNTTNRITTASDSRLRNFNGDSISRERTQESAQRLSLLALRSWEKALSGVIAVPAAAALTTGAVVLFAASIIEQTFGLVETSLAEVGKRVSEELDLHSDRLRDGNASQGVS